MQKSSSSVLEFWNMCLMCLFVQRAKICKPKRKIVCYNWMSKRNFIAFFDTNGCRLLLLMLWWIWFVDNYEWKLNWLEFFNATLKWIKIKRNESVLFEYFDLIFFVFWWSEMRLTEIKKKKKKSVDFIVIIPTMTTIHIDNILSVLLIRKRIALTCGRDNHATHSAF